MFAWLRKRKQNALLKMFFQNTAAAAATGSFYDTHGNPALAKDMRRLGELNANLRTAFERGGHLPSAGIGTLIAINEELRRHDRHLFGSALHFDESYKPGEGWRALYAGFRMSSGESPPVNP